MTSVWLAMMILVADQNMPLVCIRNTLVSIELVAKVTHENGQMVAWYSVL